METTVENKKPKDIITDGIDYNKMRNGSCVPGGSSIQYPSSILLQFFEGQLTTPERIMEIKLERLGFGPLDEEDK